MSQSTKTLNSRRHGRVSYTYTKREFGHSRCVTRIPNSSLRDVLRSQTTINRGRYEAYLKRGNFYSAGVVATVVWVGPKGGGA